MNETLRIFESIVRAFLWPLVAVAGVYIFVLGVMASYEWFVGQCRKKPERGEALGAFIRAWFSE
jgi:hypothetical protein